jgi:DNA-binding MarR family transcriptional regulator
LELGKLREGHKLKSYIQKLDLIDLISERHVQLRRITEKLWNDSNDIYVSNSEWFILARIYQKQQATISFISKQLDISRQATHKFIKSLGEKGLIEIYNLENNKKEKGLRLTELGKKCYEKNGALKSELENKIAEKIGADQVKLIKDILQSDWE